MSKNRTKIYVIEVVCAKCGTMLYRYAKEGAGQLLKCYISGVREDNTKGDRRCPKCGQEFAREAMIHGRPAHKIIQGKVNIRGHCGK